MKKYFVLALSIAISTLTFSQAENWSLYQSVEGIDIYTQEVECLENKLPDQTAYILKVVNKTNKNLTIEWDLAIWYNGKLVTGSVPSEENHQTVVLEKNEIRIGDCETPRGALYIIKGFKAASSTTKLTKFEFQNIQISKS
jgi:hypothetical protein